MGDTTNLFTFEEFTDMLLIYGKVDCNSTAAVREYREKYPHRRIPCCKTFEAVERRLRETGTLITRRTDTGRQRFVRNVNVEEEILDAVHTSPTTSTRRLSCRFNISQTSVWRILREQQLYSFHVTPVQDLLPQDYNNRKEFCQWLVRQKSVDRNFLKRILVTDESCFTRNGVVNFRNTHIWAEENPHEVAVTHFQHTFSFNVWCGILADNVIGPCFLPPRLNGEEYLNFLQTNLQELLEDVPLQYRAGMWFMHDGSPVHFSRSVTRYLNNTYGNHWIGRAGPVKWPARSPDLTPLDFNLWGSMKSLVYSTHINTQEELRNRIIEAGATLKNSPDTLSKVRKAWIRRAKCCIQQNGGHIEQLL